ncbi:hypothetical protein [Thiocapsa bogorovii]|nr:hypothetical protein [Thiocapsa bogorovii]UHD14482.1 hypothetical protein LT988_14345 [Thiocapsa bogorovii]
MHSPMLDRIAVKKAEKAPNRPDCVLSPGSRPRPYDVVGKQRSGYFSFA